MAFQTPLTINDVIRKIHAKNICSHQFRWNLYGVQARLRSYLIA